MSYQSMTGGGLLLFIYLAVIIVQIPYSLPPLLFFIFSPLRKKEENPESSLASFVLRSYGREALRSGKQVLLLWLLLNGFVLLISFFKGNPFIALPIFLIGCFFFIKIPFIKAILHEKSHINFHQKLIDLSENGGSKLPFFARPLIISLQVILIIATLAALVLYILPLAR